jgi:hypothetical protein
MSLIAYCGLNCEKCEAYIATQAGDEDAKERIAEKWRVAYNSPEITAANATCDGCAAAAGRVGGYGLQCPMRACARAKAIPTCAHCDSYASCPTLAGFLGSAPSLKDGLEAIRKSLGKT